MVRADDYRDKYLRVLFIAPYQSEIVTWIFLQQNILYIFVTQQELFKLFEIFNILKCPDGKRNLF